MTGLDPLIESGLAVQTNGATFIVRQANTGEVTELRREARDLKEVVAEQTLELRLLKKSMLGDGDELE